MGRRALVEILDYDGSRCVALCADNETPEVSIRQILTDIVSQSHSITGLTCSLLIQRYHPDGEPIFSVASLPGEYDDYLQIDSRSMKVSKSTRATWRLCG